ncbi:mannosyltransferase putative-domain-containing protein [Dunaliella salina]|uniref:Mannosyltransferase putative-domain-containing protein n=1 Tax=Dunaliella salina TaxID=3046 RepID=A0ABQ7FZS9_DUNSA|nr:mannosyltransferase putative-domain-containing protein [Dunaliella salina]|eukprot:KAF5827856.1 mannosyltransferase putative-domain-containing protein [Dunaliella salina]
MLQHMPSTQERAGQLARSSSTAMQELISSRSKLTFAAAATTRKVQEIGTRTRELWDELGSLIRSSGHDEKRVRMPPKREENRDWVTDGVDLDEQTINELRSSVHRCKGVIPPVPEGLFQGRGIATIAGGFHYMTKALLMHVQASAWIGLHLLRRSGSNLPVEMWFPVLELPTPQLEAELASLGVTVRAFDQRDLDQSGFLLKSVAIALSMFKEVLFLDADSFPLMQPEALFQGSQFEETGAVFWQDYWEPTPASEVG